MTFFTRYGRWALLLLVGSGCTEQEPTTQVRQQPARNAQPASTSPPALPARQEVRVNDTLVLECTRPYTTLVPDAGRPAMTMWAHLALRGRRGYYQVLGHPDTLVYLYGLYQCQNEPLVSAQGDVLHFSGLHSSHLAWDELPRGQPLPRLAVYELDFWVWDVRYRQQALYMTADLKELDEHTPCFTGGLAGDSIAEQYRLLPHWISQERATLQRRQRLPPARRLLAYSNYSREIAIITSPEYAYNHNYLPLLLNLLRTWRTYPMPAATAHHLDRSIQALRIALRKARTSG